MTIAVMQPYWAPYAGYFRLFVAADLFVVFDCVQFPRRGWVHRYKDEKGDWVTLPLQKAPRNTRICDMKMRSGANLSHDLLGVLVRYSSILDLPTIMSCSSDLDVDPSIHGQARVIAICKRLHADRYVNASGGRALYDPAAFADAGIKLGFLKPYEGSYESILTRLQHERPEDIADEIRRESVVEWMS